jgi:hypothetical protein
MGTDKASGSVTEFHLERYRFILQQLHTVNENVYRFLGIYQTIVTTIAGGMVALLLGFRTWGIDPATARAGVIGLMCLISLVGAFTILLLVVGMLTWLDYRREECDLTDEAVHPGFRQPPRPRNFVRWYETYIAGFVISMTVLLWLFVAIFALPAIN